MPRRKEAPDPQTDVPKRESLNPHEALHFPVEEMGLEGA
jgi:hypothetical protein